MTIKIEPMTKAVRCKDGNDVSISCSLLFRRSSSWTCTSKKKWGESIYQKGKASGKVVDADKVDLPDETTKNEFCKALGQLIEGKNWTGSPKKFLRHNVITGLDLNT